MAEVEVRLEFNGPAVEGGRMDARWVAGTLLAMSDLVTHVKQADADLHNASAPTVRVGAFEEGSFDIALLLEAFGDVWAQLRELGNDPNVSALVNLGAIMGFVLGFLKVHGDKKVRSHTVSDDGSQVEVELGGDGDEITKITMSPEVFSAFMDSRTRKAARKVIEPVERDGVDSVTISTPEAGQSVTVSKQDAPRFHYEDPEVPNETVTRRTALVQPVSINFDSEAWRVSEGAGRFTAKVEDEDFLRRLDVGTVQIGKTDTFEVGLRVEQYFDKNGSLRSRHAIERIIRHERGRAEEQGALKFSDSEAETA